MIYILNLFFSFTWIKFTQNKNKNLIIVPIIFWSLVIGFQYDVGVDYFNYLSIFNEESRDIFFLNQKEYVFYFYLKILRIFNLKGQMGFILIAFISNIIFFKSLLEYKKKIQLDISLFIFLYFTLTTVFISQMNGIRQYVGIYLFFLSGAYLHENKKKFILINCFAGLVHSSIFLAIPIVFFVKNLKKKYKRMTLLIVLLFSMIVSLININLELLFFNINSLGKYSYYLNDPLLKKNIGIIFKVTKWIYVPLYLYSIYYFENMKLSSKNIILYNLGMFSYFLKLICLITFLTIRISEIFNLFLIFPIYFLLKYLYDTRKKIDLFIIVSCIIFLFLLKYYIIPTDEIIYKMYLFY